MCVSVAILERKLTKLMFSYFQPFSSILLTNVAIFIIGPQTSKGFNGSGKSSPFLIRAMIRSNMVITSSPMVKSSLDMFNLFHGMFLSKLAFR